ncbi:hypothetical protein, partial [Novosphingobium gossypii]|uniref:hypothetical protein n=1 Tax=Novosphingobium gossypii TaxID=1604774 RepID=UPI003D1FD7AD
MTLTLGQAAKEAGVSKATLSKALKSGRLSYIAKSTAGYEIDPAELFRVFPRKQVETVHSERCETLQETPETIAYQREIELLRQQLSDAKTDRDAWREQAQRLALLPPGGSDEPKA